jgi:hypothetical protein
MQHIYCCTDKMQKKQLLETTFFRNVCGLKAFGQSLVSGIVGRVTL